MLLSLSLVLTLLLSVPSTVSALPNRKRATICNGHAELCNRSYGNITSLTSHDSFAHSSDPFSLGRDQQIDIPTQLKMGARALQAQAHMHNGQLRFCHTNCALFDGGPVVDYLKSVKTFLDANPNEVITFIFTNPDGASIPGVWKPAFDQSGITPLAYVPPSRPVKRSDWPTLGQLISMNKRVVVFLDYGADGSDGGVVDFILPEFQMVWEDPFSPTDPNFPCSISRTSGPLSNDDHMVLINHNLNVNVIPVGGGVLFPDLLKTRKTNSVANILQHAHNCATLSQARAPNFVLLDFIDIGQGMAAVNNLNGF
jgi:hypothetical protein